MKKLNNIKMKPKLIGLFLLVGLLPLLFLGWWSTQLANQALDKATFQQLVSVRDSKKKQLEKHFDDTYLALNVFSRSKDVVELYDTLVDYHVEMETQADGAYDVSTQVYQDIWGVYGDNIKKYQEESGHYDIYLICSKHGHVMYTSGKRSDMGTNLRFGPYKDSPLAEVWNNVVETKKAAIVDLQVYSVNDGKPVFFFGIPILQGNKMIGVMAVGMSVEALNKLVQNTSGMGETVETYLVGQDHLMRSDSVLNPETHSVEFSFSNPEAGTVDTLASQMSLNGETGQGLFPNYKSVSVFSAYAPVDFGSFKWGIITEVQESEAMVSVNQLILTTTITTLVIAILIIIIGVFMAVQIATPLNEGVVFASTVSSGDLTQSIETGRKDEIGILNDALNNMSGNLRGVIQDLSGNSSTLSSSSEELSAVASQMASSMEEMNSQSETIATSSEQVFSSVSTVASAAEQASSSVTNIAHMTEEMSSTFKSVSNSSRKTASKVNLMADATKDISNGVSNVAAAVEEMSASLNDVAKNTAQASSISENANQKSNLINERMNNLASASKQIGKIVGVIKDIADQTNMLALNATIEAAGAGEAGKGFAVVAGEVKELAKQSAEATDEIAGQIEQIQKTTDDAVSGILEIGNIISEIASINENNAIAVKEQTATASEISRTVAGNATSVNEMVGSAEETSELVNEIANSISEASTTAGEVAKHINELSLGVREVAESSSDAASGVKEISVNIQAINQIIQESVAGANQTSSSSSELSAMAQQLNELVCKFKL